MSLGKVMKKGKVIKSLGKVRRLTHDLVTLPNLFFMTLLSLFYDLAKPFYELGIGQSQTKLATAEKIGQGHFRVWVACETFYYLNGMGFSG